MKRRLAPTGTRKCFANSASCSFSARYMRCELMKDFDEAWLKHRTACEIAKKMRDKGVDISFIKEMTNLAEKEIREL